MILFGDNKESFLLPAQVISTAMIYTTFNNIFVMLYSCSG